jgi:hypothetical protein
MSPALRNAALALSLLDGPKISPEISNRTKRRNSVLVARQGAGQRALHESGRGIDIAVQFSLNSDVSGDPADNESRPQPGPNIQDYAKAKRA